MVYTNSDIIEFINSATGKRKLGEDILSYCTANSLELSAFFAVILKKGLMVEKYGERPMLSQNIKTVYNEEPLISTYNLELPKKNISYYYFDLENKKEEKNTEIKVKEPVKNPRKRKLETV